jgi:phosphohistidine phosphatase
MRLLVIRHGIALERQDFAKTGRPDALRPLTDGGRRKMGRAARGIHRLEPDVAILASSPLTRAIQTAQIVVRRYKHLKIVQIAALGPRKPPGQLLEWLQKNPAKGTVAIVGHEPHLSRFVGWMLTGLRESFIELKKGGAVLLELGADPRAGHAKLIWSLKPGQLRDVGK